jgi:hypothetical protein
VEKHQQQAQQNLEQHQRQSQLERSERNLSLTTKQPSCFARSKQTNFELDECEIRIHSKLF